jgi:hypothetical protein
MHLSQYCLIKSLRCCRICRSCAGSVSCWEPAVRCVCCGGVRGTAWQQPVCGLELCLKFWLRLSCVHTHAAVISAGLALGLSPAGSLLCDANAAAAFVAQHASSPFVAWELSLLLGVLRCCWETVELMASGTLALQVGCLLSYNYLLYIILYINHIIYC